MGDYKQEINNLLQKRLIETAYNNLGYKCDAGLAYEDAAKRIKIWLDELPPVKPEPLTDKEQRIFLAAMGREEKICKQVDDEYRDCMEPYEDSLVRTCHEIIRKVKIALWI